MKAHLVSNFDCEKDQQCFQLEPLVVVWGACASHYVKVNRAMAWWTKKAMVQCWKAWRDYIPEAKHHRARVGKAMGFWVKRAMVVGVTNKSL